MCNTTTEFFENESRRLIADISNLLDNINAISCFPRLLTDLPVQEVISGVTISKN